MKRVKAACILQTLVFSQKSELGFSKEHMNKINHEELERYKESLVRSKTRHIIVDVTDAEDGSVIVHVKKQYNDISDVSEYF